jgi:tetratricopeptide (TPR) repeat protein
MTKLAILILLVLSANIATAQNFQQSSSNKKAIKYYNTAVSQYQNNNYSDAIPLLSKSLKHDKNFIEAWLLLGDSYIEVDSMLGAIYSYESAIYIDSTFFPAGYYFLGNLYYKIGEYQEAIDNYLHFSHQPNASKELLLLAYPQMILAIKAARIVENPVPVTIRNLGYPINTQNDEYINYVNTSSDYMMLTRRTHITNSQSNDPAYMEELLYSAYHDSAWENPTKVYLEWKDDLNMGSLSLSTDGRIMYFTGCYWPIGQGSCDLYASHSSGSHWLLPYNLGDNINTSNWESQPIISSDSKKLFFASKRTGGHGGSDIWMSIKLKNNTWSSPINLGDSINTPKDEMSPFLHADGNTLFFASNGHPGLGGYDLFISRQDEVGRWSLAKNIGYPTNSRYNEINIFSSIDGKQSWISSDRDGGYGGMDIYSFDNYEDILPKKIMYVEGIVIDKLTKIPLEAEIQIANLSTSEVINTTISDSVTGGFLLVIFPGVDYAFNITKKGYLFLSENINLQDSAGVKLVKKQFELSPFQIGNQLIMNNVFFKFNEFELLSSSFVELDKLTDVLVQNPLFSIEIIGHTDSIGDAYYNKELSIKRAYSVGNYLIENGIKSERLQYKGMGSTMPVAKNNSEAGRAKNRRTEVRIK